MKFWECVYALPGEIIVILRLFKPNEFIPWLLNFFPWTDQTATTNRDRRRRVEIDQLSSATQSFKPEWWNMTTEDRAANAIIFDRLVCPPAASLSVAQGHRSEMGHVPLNQGPYPKKAVPHEPTGTMEITHVNQADHPNRNRHSQTKAFLPEQPVWTALHIGHFPYKSVPQWTFSGMKTYRTYPNLT